MSTKSEVIPESELPFGRRLYDEEVVGNRPRAPLKKILAAALVGVAFMALMEVSPKRKARLTPRPISFTMNQIRIEGDKIIVPALVMDFPKPLPSLAGGLARKADGIQVLNFIGDSIPPGTEGRAVLITGGTNGLVKARITEAVKVDGTAVLDAGATLIGQGRSTEERLYVDFKRAVLRDGKSIPIAAEGYDASDSMLGLKGSRVGDMSLKLAATSGLNFLSGMAVGMQAPGYDSVGRPIRPSAGDAALSGVSQAAGDEAKEIMENAKNRSPVIEVPAGTSLLLMFGGTQ
jgi:hypothetical protein